MEDTAPARPRLIGTDDAAALLDCSAVTIRTLIDSGELKGHRVGRLIKVNADSVDEYLDRQTIRRP
jgi:excisionase family DNA binding protein